MKIGIVTLPFNINYGGIVQAYALQSVLKKMGHDVLTVNRKTEGMPFKMKVMSFGRRLLLTLAGRKNIVIRTWPTKNEEKIISQHTQRFIKENIITTELFKSESDFAQLKKYNFDAYVVGSDQVWRPKYSPSLKNHFLGFVENESKIKRISYAASFGVDNWEYNAGETKVCSQLAKEFNAISVREDSGIKLCKDFLGVEAIQSMDPTLLISKEEYIDLVNKDNIPSKKGKLVTYVLDLSDGKSEIIQKIKNELNLEEISIMPEGLFRESGKANLSKCIAPPVTNWIRGFMDAEYVITDSFHGTVFSIIFNKPFVSIGNKKRGMTRFNSLLKLFDLENRLIFSDSDDLLEKVKMPIDYARVNQVLEQKKEEAFSFLKNALTN